MQDLRPWSPSNQAELGQYTFFWEPVSDQGEPVYCRGRVQAVVGCCHDFWKKKHLVTADFCSYFLAEFILYLPSHFEFISHILKL